MSKQIFFFILAGVVIVGVVLFFLNNTTNQRQVEPQISRISSWGLEYQLSKFNPEKLNALVGSSFLTDTTGERITLLATTLITFNADTSGSLLEIFRKLNNQQKAAVLEFLGIIYDVDPQKARVASLAIVNAEKKLQVAGINVWQYIR